MEFMNTRHFRVYSILDWHKNTRNKKKAWQSFPTLETIQQETKLNRQTVQVAINDLIEWGLIERAKIRRKSGGGYKNIYTIVKEPNIKAPLKKIREKVHKKKKQNRDKKGKFTGSHKPEKRTCANTPHKPENMADFRQDSNHKPENMAATLKPENMAAHKSVNMANNQSFLNQYEPVLRNPPSSSQRQKKKTKKKDSTKGKGNGKNIDDITESKKQKTGQGNQKTPCGEKEWKEAFGGEA